MPKISLTLESAKAKESDILAKLGKVQQSAHAQKQHTKLNQQRLEWIEQSKKLAADAKRLEADLAQAAIDLGSCPDELSPSEELNALEHNSRQLVSDVWFQVAGMRKLLDQVGRRDAARVQKNPEQILAFQDVLQGVSAALSSTGGQLAAQCAVLQEECRAPRRALRRELTAEGVWVSDRRDEDKCDLTDEEEALLDRIGEHQESAELYETELRDLSDRVSSELEALGKEGADLRAARTEWDADADFRFACIVRQFQGKSRDLLNERLALEFPHLTREQLLSHESYCDSLKYVRQRRAAAFRQWRRERLDLMRKTQASLEERVSKVEALSLKRQEMLHQRGKQQKLQAKLQHEKAIWSKEQKEKQRLQELENERARAEEAEKQAKHRSHAEEVKDLSEKYKERKRDEKQREEQEAAERERLSQEEHVESQERNRARVEIRQQMDQLKALEAQQRREATERERLEQEQRIQRALEKFAPQVERDPERLLKEPARKNLPAYIDPLQCVVPEGRGPHAGYHENKLMGDARYRMSVALQAAGLYGCQAGHEAMRAVAAPRPTPQHIASTVFNAG